VPDQPVDDNDQGGDRLQRFNSNALQPGSTTSVRG
jgi:hypothetical protein